MMEDYELSPPACSAVQDSDVELVPIPWSIQSK